MADVTMSSSILTSIKKMLSIEEDYEYFDVDITIFINGALFTLNQLGVGPESGFVVTDKNDTWSSFVGNVKDLEAIKTFVYLKTRLLFDPPQMGYLVDAINKQCDELVWRINVQVENDRSPAPDPPDPPLPPIGDDVVIDNHTLKITEKVLHVNTTNDALQDNTLPITSGGVQAQVGNINTLLETV